MKGLVWVLTAVGLIVVAVLLECRIPDPQQQLKAREAVLRADLQAIRCCIDQYRDANGEYPGDLDDMVEFGCLRFIPFDPITMSDNSWVFQKEGDGAIVDVRSGARGAGIDGTEYKSW